MLPPQRGEGRNMHSPYTWLLETYTDADWSGNRVTRRSTSAIRTVNGIVVHRAEGGQPVTCSRINERHYELHHNKYFAKLKPISCEDDPGTQPVADKQRTMLRGAVGALQWPATHSSPHLQATVSQLAGQVSKATLATLREANKCLTLAKVPETADTDWLQRCSFRIPA